MVNPFKFFRKMNQAADEIIKMEESVTRMETQAKEIGIIVDRIEA